ncbi:zinc-binding alcohol dehydrogenase [Agrobacterium sp. a22-2]|uniref:zinc-dependent alcohol dehydrogenase n=1 Tax=Agrobacterium sp. a22-2 TaxID=2283840 RepID=UPI001446DA51|nr:zinc-binding alcohol dehydrogenase [Agrobacterium sp. a22-2]NKN38941.1 zinc-binding alcohol dehydrogenase [Agrobacterium sp. a22-2]
MSLNTGAAGMAQTSKSRALWFPAAGTCELRDDTLPSMVDGEVRVRMLFSGISRGTENLVFAGRVPSSEFDRMRGPHMGGEFPFPVKYGYSAVGQIEAGRADLVGKAVFCLHPHQDFFNVSQAAVTVLPVGLPPARAVLAANMETALNIVWDAGILPGDRVAVFGAGVVGSLVAYLASQIIGTDVLLIDRNPARKVLADRLGLNFDAGQEDAFEFDVAVNASGSAEALARAIELAGQEARIVEASWYGDRPVSLLLGGAFHARRLTIVSSQVGSVPPARRARWTYARRLAKALELLRDDRLDALISGETGFADLATAYPAILADPQTLCHRICYQYQT